MKEIFMQFSNCVTVKGFLRSAIYDLQRNRYILVPNSFSDLMQSNNNKIPLSDCNPDFKSYLDGLVEDNWGVYTTKKAADQFPALSLYWDHFATVTNAQIDLHKENDEIRFFFKKTLPQFEELICKDYQINFPEAIEYDEIFSFLTSFNDTRVESITLVVPYLSAPREQLLDLFKKQPRLKTLFFHSSPETKYSGKDKIFYIRDHINIREKNIVLTDYFTSNVSLFSESQKHNTYYNRKLCIDINGNIKNSPEHHINYGNIKNTPIKNVMEKEEFKKLCFVHKEMIDVCRVCEFRHMCVDGCEPKQRKNGSWYRSRECNYNPYICLWDNERSYKSLNDCGITVSPDEFTVNTQKLSTINKKIWGNSFG